MALPFRPAPKPSPAPARAGSLHLCCRYCSGALPRDRAATFCPHCGENLTVRHCPACSAELDAAWRFCVSCGRTMPDELMGSSDR
ncbi:MAG: zinc ribbon domain-containing protein [Gemmatimonadaceae bacterium]